MENFENLVANSIFEDILEEVWEVVINKLYYLDDDKMASFKGLNRNFIDFFANYLVLVQGVFDRICVRCA